MVTKVEHCNCPDCICGDEDCPGKESLEEYDEK